MRCDWLSAYSSDEGSDLSAIKGGEKSGNGICGLLEIAKNTLNPRKLSEGSYAGSTAAALHPQGTSTKAYASTLPALWGSAQTTCVQPYRIARKHAAIAAMITAGETKIEKIVAVDESGEILPPCGRCRELMYQVDRRNLVSEVMLKDKVVRLEDLLPERWI
jgi:cytidine deaminase